MIEITAVSFTLGETKTHEHITAVLWRTASTSLGYGTTEAIIAWLESSTANRAVVADGSDYVEVAVVRLADRPSYLRSRLDGEWTDSLLALPIF